MNLILKTGLSLRSIRNQRMLGSFITIDFMARASGKPLDGPRRSGSLPVQKPSLIAVAPSATAGFPLSWGWRVVTG
jgi:hypothetical protein